MYGAQTGLITYFLMRKFENDVEMYGAQTIRLLLWRYRPFENDVEMYGAQTAIIWQVWNQRLRMM